jgi:diguanylate cyclase (GGDEF)-like protein/PAS domain S-box-containing protein
MTEIERLDLKSLLEHAHIGVVIHRLDISIVYANPTALKLLRMTYEQLIGRDAHDPDWYFIDEYHQRLPIRSYPVNQVLHKRTPLVNEVIGRYTPDTSEVAWFLVNAYFEGDHENSDGFIVVTFNEISARRHLFSYRDIIENTRDVVIVTDADNIKPPFGPQIVFVNRAFEILTGYTAEEAIGQTPRILQGRGTDPECTARIRNALEKFEPIRETILNYSKQGKPYWLDLDIFPLKNDFGKVSHFAAIERDVTDQIFYSDQLEKRNADLKQLKDSLERLVEERTVELRNSNFNLQRLAHYDELTGIPNRRSFREQAAKHCRVARRYERWIAVAIIDIDHFKDINDRYGHDVGDQVLVETARRFKNFFRVEDVYGRIGGEEFAAVLHTDGPEASAGVCKRLIAAFSDNPVRTDEIEINVTISVGLHVSQPVPDFNLDAAMKEADKQLYGAKRNGRNRLEYSSA